MRLLAAPRGASDGGPAPGPTLFDLPIVLLEAILLLLPLKLRCACRRQTAACRRRRLPPQACRRLPCRRASRLPALLPALLPH